MLLICRSLNDNCSKAGFGNFGFILDPGPIGAAIASEYGTGVRRSKRIDS